jgi:hypothetical protein
LSGRSLLGGERIDQLQNTPLNAELAGESSFPLSTHLWGVVAEVSGERGAIAELVSTYEVAKSGVVLISLIELSTDKAGQC